MRSRTVVSAQPGWFVVDPWIEDDDTIREFGLEPVIAWAIEITDDANEMDEPSFNSYAITAEPFANDWGDQILKRPDDTYLAPCDRSFRSEKEMLAYLNEQRLEKLERSARKHAPQSTKLQ